MINYARFIDTIHDILTKDVRLDELIRTWQKGELGSNNEINAEAFPLCRITTATNPEIERVMYSQSDTPDDLPTQAIEIELWIIIAAQEATPYIAQKKVYSIVENVERVLRRHITLGGLAIASKILHQRRYETYKRENLDAMVVRMRPIVIQTSGGPR